ncbi:IS4 family transposase [Bacteroidia bacterium]|nr:IS4 family transposase [Bacteroidia bacterium]
MVSFLQSEFGVKIKKQSLDERFGESCISYIKAVLKEVLNERLGSIYGSDLLNRFSRIRIKDSTKFMVPSTLESNYKGCGGDVHSRSKAGISIQYEYDLKSGEITDLNITPGNRNDRTDAGATAADMQQDDLIIRDLGYFSTEVLTSCIRERAFFLSRLDASTNVYDSKNNPLSFKAVYKEMSETGVTQQEMSVFIGKNGRVPVRMLLRMVPPEIYEQRIREKTQKSKGQGRGQLREETKIRCWFNLFITNADEELLPAEHIFPLYRLRWQIELHFKTWKSVFRIDRLHRMKESRYIALLCAKLLLIIINLQITYSIQQSLNQKQSGKRRILSLNKSLKTLSSLFTEIFRMLRQTGRKAQTIAQNIRKRLSENHWLESKKNKLCFPDIIELFICKSEK